MSDEIKNENDENEDENFADLLESYSSGMSESLQVGDKISGEIISIGSDAVFIDTGTKIDGGVDKAELLDENKELPYKEGDVLELFVVSVDESEIRLSKALSGIGGIHMLKDAYRNAVPVEGKVKETIKGGFHIEIMKKRAFCPISQIDLKYVENPEDYVGETFLFRIKTFEENGRNIVVSRRVILSEEQQKTEKAFFEEMKEGDVIQGQITRLMPYGAFAELIPGVEGMIHVSELAWSRIEKPEDTVKTGDIVQVKVVKIEMGEKKNKIALSMKQATADPWDTITETVKPGDKIRGRVIKCLDFGAFVEILPGIEGLVHISEMSYKKRILKPEEVVNPGDQVDVLIKDLDIEHRKISLSIRDAEGDPWIEVPEKFQTGQVVNGIVEKKEKFGFFVKLEDGITGLLPKSLISKSSKPQMIERLKDGDSITVIVENINVRERKISLSPGDSRDTDDWKKYKGDSEQSVGSLGEKLKAAMESNKK